MSDWPPPDFEPGLISVVVPTFNRADMMRQTLASLLNQTHDRLEVLMVDDGSTDSTGEQISRLVAKLGDSASRRLVYLRQDHQGAPAARNLGTARSRGEYISYLDDDDLLSTDRLQKLFETARASGAHIAFGPWTYFTQTENGFGVRALHARDPREGDRPALLDWLEGWSFYLPGTLLSRGLLGRAGPWAPALEVCQDLEFCARCLATDPVMAHTKEGTLYRRHHKSTISRRDFGRYEDSIVAFADAIERTARSRMPGAEGRSALARYLARHAVRFHERGSRRGASYCEKKAREHDPGLKPPDGGLSASLAFVLGGLRMASARNGLRSRLKRFLRKIRGKADGFAPVARLEGVNLAEMDDA